MQQLANVIFITIDNLLYSMDCIIVYLNLQHLIWKWYVKQNIASQNSSHYKFMRNTFNFPQYYLCGANFFLCFDVSWNRNMNSTTILYEFYRDQGNLHHLNNFAKFSNWKVSVLRIDWTLQCLKLIERKCTCIVFSELQIILHKSTVKL